MNSRDASLREMSVHFKDIANWAVEADEYEIMIVNQELSKLVKHLQTMKIVQDANKLPDLMDDESLKTDA